MSSLVSKSVIISDLYTLQKVMRFKTMGPFGLSLFLLKLKTETENTVAK